MWARQANSRESAPSSIWGTDSGRGTDLYPLHLAALTKLLRCLTLLNSELRWALCEEMKY